ncbi:MAG: M23 family metallopeptidase, partial [Clostridia bacterium]
ITSNYGPRFDPIFKTNKMHTGVDIGAPMGAEIVAANSGTVIVAGFSSRGYGNYVVINHGGGKSTLYAHQSSLAVSRGDHVNRGQTIGYVGTTGYSTGPHLHYEFWVNNQAVN